MLPYLYEFSWQAAHLVFLCAFGAVVVTIVVTLAVAAGRAERRLKRSAARSPVRAHSA